MSTCYWGCATILHPLSRETLKPIVQKLFEQIDKEAPMCNDPEEFLDTFLSGKKCIAWWRLRPEGYTSEDDEVSVPVDISVKSIDDESFKLFFLPYPSFVTIKGEIDFSWYFQKLLELTNPLPIGACLFEDATHDTDFDWPKLNKWGVYAIGHKLIINSASMTSDYKAKYIAIDKTVISDTVEKLKTIGWHVEPQEFSEELVNNEEFSLYATLASSTVQIRYTDTRVYIVPMGEKPLNVRPYLEILAIVCTGASMSYIEANNMMLKDLSF